MFEYLKGTITGVQPGYAVLDVAGVGYKLFCPQPYAYELDQEVKIFVEQVIRENEQTLYGFLSLSDKQLFLKLTSVSGIGPKSALAIMAAENSAGLANAIENGEVKYLTQFPGVGKKTASQIILDLKGKLEGYVTAQQLELSEPENHALNDAILALVALGYTQKEVDKITPKLRDADLAKAEEYIKLGLNLLLKKG